MDLVKRKGQAAGSPLARLRDEMDDLFRGFFDDWSGWPRAGLAAMQGGWWPSVDVLERDDKIIVRAELPGVKNEDVEVSVHNDTLTIGGEKKEESQEKGEGFYHTERRYGSFRRDIRLPAGVDEGKIEATCHDGVLTVTLPKSEKARPRRIEVKS